MRFVPAGAAAVAAVWSATAGVFAALVGFAGPGAAQQTTVPASPPNVNPADAAGFRYERRRIKRTVPLDFSAPLEARWDLLYVAGSGGERRAAYLDWDDDFLYLALESPAPENLRVDLDAKGDGWFRGADNVVLEISASGALAVARWDTVQNKERPVWAQSPIPASAVKTMFGRTPAGTFAVLLAVARTEAAGLERRPGAAFGLRASWGEPPVLPGDVATGAPLAPTSFTPRPLLTLALADTVPVENDAAGAAAAGDGLSVRVSVAPRQVVLGTDQIRATLTAKNETAAPIRVSRLFLRGSQASAAMLDAATYTGATLGPGETVRRDFVFRVAQNAGLGSLVVAGGIEQGGGKILAALATFDRVEPYAVAFVLENRPVAAAASAAPPQAGTAAQAAPRSSVTYQKRSANVTIRSRTNQRENADVTLDLPAGWGLEGGDQRRRVELPRGAGSERVLRYNVLVPPSAAPGVYAVRVTVQAGERTYSASERLAISAPAAAPALAP